MSLKACLLVTHLQAATFLVNVEDAVQHKQRRPAIGGGSIATTTPANEDIALAGPDATHAATAPKIKSTLNSSSVEAYGDSYEAGAQMSERV